MCIRDSSSAAQGNAAAPTELSASSSVEDVVNYFNKAINNVKPNAKEEMCIRDRHYVSLCICGAYIHIAPAEAHKIGVAGVLSLIHIYAC